MGVEDMTAKGLKGTYIGNENYLLPLCSAGYTGIFVY